MLMILTGDVDCDECGRPAASVAVDLPHEGFVTQLCPVHVAAFLQVWLARPEDACHGLKKRRLVVPDR